MLHVRVLHHLDLVLEVFVERADDDLVIELTIVTDGELDLLSLADVDLVRDEPPSSRPIHAW